MRPTFLLIAALAACATPLDRGAGVNERLAEAASRRGDWATAADLWHRVYLADELENARACLETSRALLELGDLDSAEALVADGVQRFPEDSALREYHGVALEAAGYRRAAEEAYASALELQPSLVRALLGLGRVRLLLGLESSAVEPLKRLVELDPSGEALRLLARAARATGDYVVAYDTYLHLFDIGEGDLEEIVGAASLGLEPSLRRSRRASPLVCEAWLARVVEEDPQQTQAHILLGAYRELDGDDEAAVVHLMRACETDPACADAYLDLAEVHLKLSEREAALTFLEHAEELVEGAAARARLSTLRARAEDPLEPGGG